MQRRARQGDGILGCGGGVRGEEKTVSYLYATHIRTRTTYTLELARAGCRKIVATAMPADRPGPDHKITLRQVPLEIRRAARRSLFNGLPGGVSA